jgi:hypothetical protein
MILTKSIKTLFNYGGQTMRFINYITLISILGLSTFIPSGCSKDSKSPEVKLTVLNSMERIGQNQELFGENQASVKAAKNEVESF